MSEDHSLTPVVYAELRRMAGAMMLHERRDHTLDPTALAHEVWLRLSRSRNAHEQDRGAFLGLAAQAMRRILTDHARARAASKRGPGLRRTTLSGVASEREPQDFAIDLDAALSCLEGVDADLAKLVELRFYGGCSMEEVATSLCVSERTAKRRWRLARAWLQQRMGGEDQ